MLYIYQGSVANQPQREADSRKRESTSARYAAAKASASAGKGGATKQEGTQWSQSEDDRDFQLQGRGCKNDDSGNCSCAN
jgi:hypothetical protein